MSTRKRPLGEIFNPPNTTQTPNRYAPSTPHAVRALQQRSGAKTRSMRVRKFLPDEVNPTSARGVLRRFAKITAPATRPRRTPRTAGKENVQPLEGSDDDDGDRELKKPRMTFDIDESIEESIEEDPPDYVEEDDSELPTAPTPSVLPDDGADPTITFQSIDLARHNERRKSRMSLPVAGDQSPDNDATIMTERGRRAFTEDATGRLSRYSFGSIRMSDFGPDLEVARVSGAKSIAADGGYASPRQSFLPPAMLDETQDLSRMAETAPGQPIDDADMPIYADDDFQLPMPDDETFVVREDQLQKAPELVPNDGWEDVDVQEADPVHLSPKSKRRLTQLQLASSKHEVGRRRRTVKMTKHGTLVPALPSSLIKKIATEVQVRNGGRKPAFGPDHTKALEQATEWFFEQVGEDLAAYSTHGRRKRRIDGSDVLLLMRRQRTGQGTAELRELAKDWLPKDVFKTLDLSDE